jgi:hypothetical protein
LRYFEPGAKVELALTAAYNPGGGNRPVRWGQVEAAGKVGGTFSQMEGHSMSAGKGKKSTHLSFSWTGRPLLESIFANMSRD